MSFAERLAAAVIHSDTCLCVGIDPWADRLPGRGALSNPTRPELAELARRFGLAVVDAATGQVPAVKPQFAFFEALGPEGMAALADVCVAARAAGLLVIGDAKRGDIGSTATAYAEATLSAHAPFPCDALTVSPFLGPDTVEPFLSVAEANDRGLFVLLRTSNPGSARWQEPVVTDLSSWIDAQNAERGEYGPLGAVVGATHRDVSLALRAAMPHTWFLVPGFGAQGGSAADAKVALRPDGLGALIVSARGATFPSVPSPDYDANPVGWIRARIGATRAELAAG
ncbi:orotidine 5'-phosphate decarboxylase [Deltaproteobacteria bacterium]|nr:orotidine 5'-phosphate decarboxylase [Deltaproteobacteria bacterium]